MMSERRVDFAGYAIPTATRVMFRCPVKGCRHTVRRVYADKGTASFRNRYGTHEYTVYGPTVRGRVVPWDSREAAYAGIYPECPEHDRTMRGNAMRGAYSETTRCDARCTGARGHDCECSCGGENHGSDHDG